MIDLKLIGSRIIKLTAERNPDFSGKLKINSNVKINSIEKIKEAKGSLKVSYNFKIDYLELGEISIDGSIFLSTEPKKIKEILKNFGDKKFDTPENITITNLILQKASIRAFEIEEELGLPIHIKLPSISIKK